MRKKPTAYLAPDVLIRYFAYGVPDIDKCIENADPKEFRFMTSDFSLYEVVAALESGELDHEKLKKLLFFMEIIPSPMKLRMTHARKMKLRKDAGIA